MTMNFVCIEFR